MTFAPIEAPPSPASRLARSLMGALLFGIVAPMLMGLTGFMVAAGIPGAAGERSGYTVLALCFLGIPTGAVMGFLVSIIATPPRLTRRWVITAVIFAIAGAAFAVNASRP